MRRAAGFLLLEQLLGMALAAGVLWGALHFVTLNVRGHTQLMQWAQQHQAAMQAWQLTGTEVRRHGQWHRIDSPMCPSSSDWQVPTAPPALGWDGKALTLTHDLSSPGEWRQTGFKWEDHTLKYRLGTWQATTDPDVLRWSQGELVAEASTVWFAGNLQADASKAQPTHWTWVWAVRNPVP